MMINQQAEILGITRNPFGSPFFKEKVKVHPLINGASCERGITLHMQKQKTNKQKKTTQEQTAKRFDKEFSPLN